MTQCLLVSHDTPEVTRAQWDGYVPRKGETVCQENGQRWVIQNIELSLKAECVTLTGIRLYPLIEQ